MLDLLDTFAPLDTLQRQVNVLLDDFLEEPSLLTSQSELQHYPPVNIWEDADVAHLEAELPGIKMEDVELLVSGNQVTLGIDRRISIPEKATWHRQERISGKFTRTFTLPWDLNSEKVEARLQDGILKVKLPKTESAKPRKIRLVND